MGRPYKVGGTIMGKFDFKISLVIVFSRTPGPMEHGNDSFSDFAVVCSFEAP